MTTKSYKVGSRQSPVGRFSAYCLLLTAYCLLSFAVSAKEWRLRVVGNLAFGADWTPILQQEGAEYPFRSIAPFLSEADLTVGFLDGTLSESGESMPWAKSPLRSHPNVALALKAAGFDAVSMACPHAADFGTDAMLETRELLESGGIAAFGVGENDTLSRMYALLTAGEIRVACLGYLHGVQPSHASVEDPGTNPALLSSIREDISNARQSADVVLVFVHWGETPGDNVDGRQVMLAEEAANAGADALFGLRAQTWQGVGVIQDKPICYSLADFIAGTKAKRYGRILLPTLVFENAKLQRVEWTAVRVDAALKFGEDPALRLQPRLLDAAGAKDSIAEFVELSKPLGTTLTITETGAVLMLPVGDK